MTVAALTTGRWSELPPAPIVARSRTDAVWTGREMIVWTGVDGAAYDPRRDTWRYLPDAPTGPYIDAPTVWTGRELFIHGGAYDPDRNAWRALAPSPIPGNAVEQALWTGEQVFVLGVRRAVAYDPARDEWTAMPPIPQRPHHNIHRVIAVATDVRIEVFAAWLHRVETPMPDGMTGVRTASGIDRFRLDLRSRTWAALPDDPDSPNSSATPLWTGQEILVPPGSPWQGGGGRKSPAASGWRLDPATDRWHTIAEGPRGGISVWTGTTLLTFNRTHTGGHIMQPLQHVAGLTDAWDPASDTWTQLPTARWSGGAGVWTGSELLVWGEMRPSYPMGNGNAPTPPPRTLGLRFGPSL